jgi:hypothetical protein
MKVYILINDGKTEGVFTSDGKKAKDKKLLEEAHIRRLKYIDALELWRADCKKKAEYYYNHVARLCHVLAPSEYLNLMALRGDELHKCKKIEEKINELYQMSAEEIIKEYCPQYSWKEQELEGD